jgi:hypothetical protein
MTILYQGIRIVQEVYVYQQYFDHNRFSYRLEVEIK